MKKIGFITCEEESNLYYDDQNLLPLFKKSGIEIFPMIWDKSTNYEDLDLLIFRSAWDYHFKTAQFESWLIEMKQCLVPICNPISIIQKNYNKLYLKDLQDKGFSIIPTLFFEDVRKVNLEEILQKNNWEKGVIKPVISMSAYHTYAFDENNAANLQKDLVNYYGKTTVMVQKFAKEITIEGEWSIIFYDKEYCMSALKKPKKGDFRVQGELGGTIEILDPPRVVIQQAKTILESYDEDILYARMDGVIHNGQFQLMEAELIDPELYFRVSEKGQKAFLQAIQKRLNLI